MGGLNFRPFFYLFNPHKYIDMCGFNAILLIAPFQLNTACLPRRKHNAPQGVVRPGAFREPCGNTLTVRQAGTGCSPHG